MSWVQHANQHSCLLLAGHVSKELITTLYDANNFVFLFARVPQIYQNFKNRSTGQLSLITYSVNFLGCIARIFTTLQEGGGAAMLRNFILSLVLNGILVAQILMYGNKGVKQTVSQGGKPKKQQ